MCDIARLVLGFYISKVPYTNHEDVVEERVGKESMPEGGEVHSATANGMQGMQSTLLIITVSFASLSLTLN